MLTLFNLKFKIMKWYKLFNDNIPQRKCADPLTALAIGSSIVGGIGNLFGQSSANDTNLMIARQNREWQSEENQKARDYQTEMWERQNEYNTPSNQRQLLEDAGYNPFVLQQNGSTSSAGGVSAPGLQSSPNQPHIEPINPLGGVSSLMNAVHLANEKEQVDSSVESNKANIAKTLASMYVEAYDKLGQKGADEVMDKVAPILKGLDMSGSRSEQLFNETVYGYRLDNARKQLDNEFQSIENKWYDILSKDKHNLNLDSHTLNVDLHRQYQYTLNKIKAEISEIYSRRDLNVEQKKFIIEQRTGEIIDNGLKGLDFQNKKDLQDVIQEGIKESVRNLQSDTDLKTTRRQKEGTTTRVGPFEFHPNADYNDYYPWHSYRK